MTVAEHIAQAAFWIAAFFALFFPAAYFFGSPWRSTIVGKMMMTKSSAIALVFLLSILFRFVPDFPMRDWLVAAAYVYLAVALGFQSFVLLGQQRHQQGRRYDRADVSARPQMEEQR